MSGQMNGYHLWSEVSPILLWSLIHYESHFNIYLYWLNIWINITGWLVLKHILCVIMLVFSDNHKWYHLCSLKSCWQIFQGCGLFRFSPPPPSPTDKIIIPPPLADMLSWAVWFKFLLNKVNANTCLFILTRFSKQSASWKVLEICELCALSTDSRKTYSVNKYIYTGHSSYSFDWGGEGWGNNPLGGKKRKIPQGCFKSKFC